MAFYDPTSPNGWLNLDGPGVVGPIGTYTFLSNPISMVFKAGVTYYFAFYATAAVVAPLATPTPSVGGGVALSGPNYGPNSTSWGPAAVANALHFPVQNGFNGAGLTIAVVSASNVYASDVTAYQSYFQTPQTGRAFNAREVDGANVTQVGTDLNESTLDVETIAALAPGVNIIDYVVPTLSTADLNDAYNQINVDKLATIANVSFVGCESNVPVSTLNATSATLATAAQNGIAFIAAAGDAGSACNYGSNPNTYVTGVQYPASDPNVIGVGGTETAMLLQGGSGTLTSTAAWNDHLATGALQEAGGGGVSAAFPLPAYQSIISGAASAQFRNVPDIAMPAVLAPVYIQGSWTVFNGTSWGAPQFAAMLAEVYQYCNQTTIPNPASLPYAVYAIAGYNAFLDVVAGNNSFNLLSGPTTAYSAHSGYDNASGIGVPLGTTFANALCPNRVLSATARRPYTVIQAQTRTAQAYQIDATPRVRGLIDLGRKGANETVGIQIVVSAAGSIAANEAQVISTLTAAGFVITRTFSNHLIVDAAGPSSVVESLFSTQMHNASQPQVGNVYLPGTALTVPASLAPVVAGAVLDNVVLFSPSR
jgi:subtilase family serine protease